MLRALFVFALLMAPAAQAASWSPLLSPDEIAGRADVVILDVRQTPETFAEGAIHAPLSLWRGPEANPGELPDDDSFSETVSALGLTPETAIVIAHPGRDRDGFAAAARVYWTLKSLGFEKLAILRGGMAAWTATGHATSSAPAERAATEVEVSFADQWLADWEAVEEAQAGETVDSLIDSRPDAFLTGEFRHPFATTGGTLEGSEQVNHENWFNEQGDLKSADVILSSLPGAVSEAEGGIFFCNTGLWAATNWFVTSELGGSDNMRLYAESIVGWTSFGGETVILNDKLAMN